jgi:ribosomal-protein-alanine N-acetyltransferase
MYMNIPSIQTKRMILRGFTSEDFEPLCVILSNRDVLRYLPNTEPFPPQVVERIMQRQAKHWQEHGYGWYAVADRQTAELVGWCGLNVLEETGETEIKYLLDKPYWGRGLATEAATYCMQEGFDEHGLGEIIGLVHPQNTASRRVLVKLGLRFTGDLHLWGLDLERYARRRMDGEGR